jgi:hypothetical protein
MAPPELAPLVAPADASAELAPPLPGPPPVVVVDDELQAANTKAVVAATRKSMLG